MSRRKVPVEMWLTPLEGSASLTSHQGWSSIGNTDKRMAPPARTAGEIDAMATREKLLYNEDRKTWHANLGPYMTTDFVAAMDVIDDVVDSNRQDADKVRSAAVLDAWPGLGKTTLAVYYAREYQRRQLDLYGPETTEGTKHIPVAFIRLAGVTTVRSLNQSLCQFYGHPGADSGNADILGKRAAQAARDAWTRLIVIDDLNFININTKNGREAANHFKWLANEFQVTFLYVGVGLKANGLLREGLKDDLEHFAQIARRWTRTSLKPFAPDDPKTWRKILLSIEKDPVSYTHLTLPTNREV